SEILSLSAEGGFTRGVDSVHTVDQAGAAAKSIASSLGCTIAVTGENDLVTDGRTALIVSGGHPLMKSVTGTGCAASVIIAAFLSVEPDPMAASVSALAFFKLAAERAAELADAPGSFWVQVLDAMYRITPEELAAKARITPA
ncbi:MAG: hydroxyethylthiazole kinase, partial [Pseudomonadota bacterium]